MFTGLITYTKTLNILLDTVTFWKFHKLEPGAMVRWVSNLLVLFCGTAFRTISGLKIAFLNLWVSYSLWRGQNASVLLVDNCNVLVSLIFHAFFAFLFNLIKVRPLLTLSHRRSNNSPILIVFIDSKTDQWNRNLHSATFQFYYKKNKNIKNV